MVDDYQTLKEEYDIFSSRIIVWLSYGLPILILLISVPLILELIPLNGPIGYRTSYTLSNSEIWYSENRKAGILITIVSIISLIFNYFNFKFSKKPAHIKGLFSISLYIFLIIVVISNLGP